MGVQGDVFDMRTYSDCSTICNTNEQMTHTTSHITSVITYICTMYSSLRLWQAHTCHRLLLRRLRPPKKSCSSKKLMFTPPQKGEKRFRNKSKQGEGAGRACCPTSDGAAIKLKLITHDNYELDFTYNIPVATALNELMKTFCQRRGSNMQQVQFVFDGQRIWPEQTPKEVGISAPLCQPSRVLSAGRFPTDTRPMSRSRAAVGYGGRRHH